MSNIKIKAWFVYQGSPNWLHCNMIFENGWCAFGHLCSNKEFASSDLWGRREERKDIIEKMGIEVELMGTIPCEELPKEVDENNKDEKKWKEMAEKYQKVKKELGYED